MVSPFRPDEERLAIGDGVGSISLWAVSRHDAIRFVIYTRFTNQKSVGLTKWREMKRIVQKIPAGILPESRGHKGSRFWKFD